MRRAAVVIVIACAACAGTPSLPEGAGKGLISWDREAPADTPAHARPVWTDGDELVFRRGGALRMAYRVAAVEAGWEMTEREGDVVLRFSADLGEIGQRIVGRPYDSRELTPPDPLFHWPLWVGKKWTAQIVRKRAGQPALPIEARYVVEELDTIRVPAGEFEALRIRRTSRPLTEGEFLGRTTLYWYSPKVGFIVRRLERDTLLELESWHRQAR